MNLPAVDSLRCFCAAAKFLDFRAASRSVALTPAAFGQRIKRLEDQLGAQLFVRTTRSLRLPTAGLALLPAAQRAQASLEDCPRAVSPGGSLPPMDLVIRQRVLAGAGVGVLPKYLVEHDLDAKRLRIVLPNVAPLHD